MTRNATGKSAVAQAVETCHECLQWIIPLLDQFPRNRRFTLGERIEAGLLNVLELLLEAAYTREKSRSLAAANRRLAVVRHLWRLCVELKVIPLNRYEHGTGLFLDLGRQIGGWHRSLASA
ncbi:MAG: diversity-generating retroelement protein Avd [Pseudomonadales bacterium]